jgi:DNA replicative helicase MCM subunit Mcm2 (Cdc46/Mcm family)
MGSKEKNPDLWDQFKREFKEIIEEQECMRKINELANHRNKRLEFNLDSLNRSNLKASEDSPSKIDLVKMVLNYPSDAITIVEELLEEAGREGLKDPELNEKNKVRRPLTAVAGLLEDQGDLQRQLRSAPRHASRTQQQTHQQTGGRPRNRDFRFPRKAQAAQERALLRGQQEVQHPGVHR